MSMQAADIGPAMEVCVEYVEVCVEYMYQLVMIDPTNYGGGQISDLKTAKKQKITDIFSPYIITRQHDYD